MGGIWVITVTITGETKIGSCFTFKDNLEVPEECIKKIRFSPNAVQRDEVQYSSMFMSHL